MSQLISMENGACEEVHAHINRRRGQCESNVCVRTALLKVYAKCCCIKEARGVFDKLTNWKINSQGVMSGA